MSQVPPPNYYYPNPGPAAGQTSGWAVFSLIAGILAWLGVFGLGGIAAVVAGYIARSEINSSGGRISGSGMATAGLVLGYINIALTLLGICLIALALAGLIASPAVCAPFMNNINTNFSFIP